MTYYRRYSYYNSKSAAPGRNAPAKSQTDYLAKLVEQAGMSQDEWRESVGLYEHSMWGKRLRAEMITRTAVSRWIDDLKIKIMDAS